MAKQLDKETINNIHLTLVNIEREDHLGKYSFPEIGYRINPEHNEYKEGHHNFELIHIPNHLNTQIAWEITKKLVKKNKDTDTINNLLTFISDRGFTRVKPELFQG